MPTWPPLDASPTEVLHHLAASPWWTLAGVTGHGPRLTAVFLAGRIPAVACVPLSAGWATRAGLTQTVMHIVVSETLAAPDTGAQDLTDLIAYLARAWTLAGVSATTLSVALMHIQAVAAHMLASARPAAPTADAAMRSCAPTGDWLAAITPQALERIAHLAVVPRNDGTYDVRDVRDGRVLTTGDHAWCEAVVCGAALLAQLGLQHERSGPAADGAFCGG